MVALHRRAQPGPRIDVGAILQRVSQETVVEEFSIRRRQVALPLRIVAKQLNGLNVGLIITDFSQRSIEEHRSWRELGVGILIRGLQRIQATSVENADHIRNVAIVSVKRIQPR